MLVIIIKAIISKLAAVSRLKTFFHAAAPNRVADVSTLLMVDATIASMRLKVGCSVCFFTSPPIALLNSNLA